MLRDVLVVVASQYDLGIAEQLLKLGITQFGVFNYDLNRVDYFRYNMTYSIQQKHNKIALIKDNNSGSNTYALYKRIPKSIVNKYEVVLIDKNQRHNNYYMDLLESKLVVYTHESGYSDTQINVQLWHGFPLKTLSYMAKFSGDIKKRRNVFWNKLEAVASYSQTYSTFMNACYGINGDKYHVTGMPRNDLLQTADGKNHLSNLLGLDVKNKRVILYMPTYRETKHGLINGDAKGYNLFSCKALMEEEFNNFLKELNSVLVIKPHPFEMKKEFSHLTSPGFENIFILDDPQLRKCNQDLYEVLNAIDILITDYSSIYFDFLLLQRPIIFVPFDLKEYETNRGLLVEPYEFWAPGPKCYTLAQLKVEILKCLNDKNYFHNERETISNIVHHYKDANSCTRVWKLLDDIMTRHIAAVRV